VMGTGEIKKGGKQVARRRLRRLDKLWNLKMLDTWRPAGPWRLQVDKRQRAVGRAQVDADKISGRGGWCGHAIILRIDKEGNAVSSCGLRPTLRIRQQHGGYLGLGYRRR